MYLSGLGSVVACSSSSFELSCSTIIGASSSSIGP